MLFLLLLLITSEGDNYYTKRVVLMQKKAIPLDCETLLYPNAYAFSFFVLLVHLFRWLPKKLFPLFSIS